MLKGLILAGGRGTRLRPLTFNRAKQLIPIANKPILYYGVEDLVAAGILDIGVIISPDTGDEVRAALGDGSLWKANFTFLTQQEPLGLAHAVKTARTYLADDPFVMYLGDNLLSSSLRSFIDEYVRTQADSLILMTPVADPRPFGVVELDAHGHVARVVEKPEHPLSNLALVGIYLFSPVIHKIIDELTPSQRGEYEISDAIQGLINQGYHVCAHQVDGWWKDTGRPEDLLEANRLVLSHVKKHIAGELINTEVVGDVFIEEGVTIMDSIIRGPVHIVLGTEIHNSYIGPYTSIGHQVRIENSEVEFSIIMDQAQVMNIPYRINDSVIGQSVYIEGQRANVRHNTIQFVLGDASHVLL